MVDCYSRLYRTVFVFLFVCFVGSASSQVVNVNTLLDSLAKKEIPQLNHKVSISISQMHTGEFIRAIANESGLNISIPSGLNNNVNNNFKDVAAKDILAYLCKDNDLELGVMGNILKISRKPAPIVKGKEVTVVFDKLMSEYMIDLSGDNLGKVVKKLSEVSGKNVILAPGLTKQSVSGFYRSKDLKEILELLAHSNNLKVKLQGNGVFILEKKFSADISKFKNLKPKSGGKYNVSQVRNVTFKCFSKAYELNKNNDEAKRETELFKKKLRIKEL